MPIDRKTYFDAVRESVFDGAMTQEQVDGQNTLLDYWERDWEETSNADLRWLSYIFATTEKETDAKFQPIEEYGKGAGKPYGVEDPETKQTYYGRGYVQLTWRDNYARASEQLGLGGDDDLELHADRALDPTIAAAVIYEGMREGWFTGQRLEEYFNDDRDDPYNAREIVNGHDCASEIAAVHDKFLTALKAAHRQAPRRQKITVAITAPEGVEVEVFLNDELI